MEPVIFVEVLDARGLVKHRWRCTEFPVRIGRGYRNDVILDDGYVSPEHAQVTLSADGTLTLEDRGSTNGLIPHGARARHPTVPVMSGTRVRVGRTTLRFCSADHLVQEAVHERTGWFRLLDWIERPAVAWAVIAATVGAYSAVERIESTTTERMASALGVGLAVFAVAALWAGIWSLAGRGVSHRFRFVQHLTLACAAGLVFGTIIFVEGYLEYVFPRSDVFAALAAVGFLALSVGSLFGHLTLVGATTPVRRAVWSIGVVAVLTGFVVWISSVSEEAFDQGLVLDVQLKPVNPRWLATSTVEEFFDSAAEAKELVDDLVGGSGSTTDQPELASEQP